MCGICVVAFCGAPPAPVIIEDMVTALRHRGPDGEGIEHLQGCDLGHARLSIIDLEGGQQPMADSRAKYSLSFNGKTSEVKVSKVISQSRCLRE